MVDMGERTLEERVEKSQPIVSISIKLFDSYPHNEARMRFKALPSFSGTLERGSIQDHRLPI